ncbi:MAG: CoA transferase [Actinomycetota bacterium]|nr:CoA transferase [Actinomycetota bacterium]
MTTVDPVEGLLDMATQMPLSEMTVVDISQQLPGPYCTALLASLGARVIKVEPPIGDPARSIDPAMFAMVNDGKEFVRLDLKAAGDVERLHRLVAEADVFVEGFRPGVAARLGAGVDTLAALKAALVYCSISGTGQSGPLAGVPVHDLNLQGLAGIRGTEVGIGIPWVDLGTASMAALAIVASWGKALVTGRGCFIDAAMLDTSVLWGRVKEEAHDREEPTYGRFATSDGLEVTVAVLEDHIWRRLCLAFGWQDWVDHGDLATYAERVVRASEIRSRLAEACLCRSRDELVDLAVEYDLPMTPSGASIGSAAEKHLLLRALGPVSGRSVPAPLMSSLPSEGRS